MRIEDLRVHVTYSFEFEVLVDPEASYTQMMTIYSSMPNAYAPHNPDTGSESLYLFEDKLYYNY
jgi:hypothetical protein